MLSIHEHNATLRHILFLAPKDCLSEAFSNVVLSNILINPLTPRHD